MEQPFRPLGTIQSFTLARNGRLNPSPQCLIRSRAGVVSVLLYHQCKVDAANRHLQKQGSILVVKNGRLMSG